MRNSPGGLLRALALRSRREGAPVYAVGGCVRDWLMGRPMAKDLDLLIESDPEPWARFCRERWGGSLEGFDQFGTIRLLLPGGGRIDFARARKESYRESAALPLVEPATLREDLARRDFSINAMAAAVTPGGFGDVVDPEGGLSDLKRRRIRVLHPRSFEDDPTRLFRAARLAARFGFRLDPETDRLRLAAVRGRYPERLSRERLRAELLRILEEKNPLSALRLLRRWGLAQFLHPRLDWPEDLGRGRTALERLGIVACRMGSRDGAELIRSLNLERSDSQALLLALELLRRREVPRGALPPLAQEVLRIACGWSSKKLRPLLLKGEDLMRLGLRPGPAYSRLLAHAAAAQWKGAFSTKREGIRWLKKRVQETA